MLENNFAVSIVNYACPICGKQADSAIIMNTHLTKESAKQVDELNHKTIDWSESACKECAAHKDDCIYIIEIDPEKSEPSNPYRTGNYWGLRKDFGLFIDYPEYILKTKDGVQFCFMDKELAIKLGLPQK